MKFTIEFNPGRPKLEPHEMCVEIKQRVENLLMGRQVSYDKVTVDYVPDEELDDDYLSYLSVEDLRTMLTLTLRDANADPKRDGPFVRRLANELHKRGQ